MFRHVIVVVFENHERATVAGAPTFAMLARRYASLTHYTAVAHPSLPNYLALVSGSTHGAPGWTGASYGRYAKKHDPFLYFQDILDRRSQLQRIVPLTALAGDISRNRLPAYSLVVPDLCHDMHDCPVSTGDRWLRETIVPILSAPALRRSVVFVVFDEGTTDDGGGGDVLALALGPLVRPGAVSAAPTNHYGLLRTIEDAWHLPRLGRSDSARPITDIWSPGS